MRVGVIFSAQGGKKRAQAVEKIWIVPVGDEIVPRRRVRGIDRKKPAVRLAIIVFFEIGRHITVDRVTIAAFRDVGRGFVLGVQGHDTKAESSALRQAKNFPLRDGTWPEHVVDDREIVLAFNRLQRMPGHAAIFVQGRSRERRGVVIAWSKRLEIQIKRASWARGIPGAWLFLRNRRIEAAHGVEQLPIGG